MYNNYFTITMPNKTSINEYKRASKFVKKWGDGKDKTTRLVSVNNSSCKNNHESSKNDMKADKTELRACSTAGDLYDYYLNKLQRC